MALQQFKKRGVVRYLRLEVPIGVAHADHLAFTQGDFQHTSGFNLGDEVREGELAFFGLAVAEHIEEQQHHHPDDEPDAQIPHEVVHACF